MRRSLAIMAVLGSIACVPAGEPLEWPSGDWADLIVVSVPSDRVGAPTVLPIEADVQSTPSTSIALAADARTYILGVASDLGDRIPSITVEAKASLEFREPLACPDGLFDPEEPSTLSLATEDVTTVFEIEENEGIVQLEELPGDLEGSRLVFQRSSLCDRTERLVPFAEAADLFPPGSRFARDHCPQGNDNTDSNCSGFFWLYPVGENRVITISSNHMFLIERGAPFLDDPSHFISAEQLQIRSGPDGQIAQFEHMVEAANASGIFQVVLSHGPGTRSWLVTVRVTSAGIEVVSTHDLDAPYFTILPHPEGWSLLFPDTPEDEVLRTRTATSAPESTGVTLPFTLTRFATWTSGDEIISDTGDNQMVRIPWTDPSQFLLESLPDLLAPARIFRIAHDRSEVGRTVVFAEGAGAKRFYERIGTSGWRDLSLTVPAAASECALPPDSCGRLGPGRKADQLIFHPERGLQIVFENCGGVFFEERPSGCELGLVPISRPLPVGIGFESFSPDGRFVGGPWGRLYEIRSD